MANREISEDQLEIDKWPISTRSKNILLKNNISLSFLKEAYLEDLKSLPGMGPSTLSEIRDYIHDKYKIVLKRKPVEKKKKIEDVTSARQVVQHFLALQIEDKKIDWPRQLLVANQLLKKYSLEKLLSIKPKKEIYSLVWYLADYGAKYINENTPVVIVKKKEEVKEVIQEEVGSIELDIVISKPKSLKDFLSVK